MIRKQLMNLASCVLLVGAPVVGDVPSKDTILVGDGSVEREIDQLAGEIARDPGEDLNSELPKTLVWNSFGYLRLTSGWYQNDSGNLLVGRRDGFAIQNARLGVRAQWHRISAVASMDLANIDVDQSGRQHLESGLKDLYVDLDTHRFAALRVARFKTIFDREEFASTTERRFIARAVSSRGVPSYEGWGTQGLGVGRDLGIAIRSEKLSSSSDTILGYEVSVQNGAGERLAADGDDGIALGGAFFGTMAGVHFHGAVRYNGRTEGEVTALRDEDDVMGAAGLGYNHRNFSFDVQGLVRTTAFPTVGAPRDNGFGFHGEVWGGNEKWWIGYRYSFLEPSSNIVGDRVQEHTLGALGSFPDWNTRFLFNVTLPVEESGRTLDNMRVEGLLEISLPEATR